MSSKKRASWDEVVGAAAAAPKEKKRTSGRHATLSKAMRVVDEETRKEVRDARLDALEADNYVENADDAGDDAYVDSDDEDRGPGTKRDSKRKRSSTSKALAGGSKLISSFKTKSLVQWVNEAGYDDVGPNYSTVAARPSSLPQRKFCSVCGFWGLYSCTRCGMRFCCNKCAETHKETRCLKFAVG